MQNRSYHDSGHRLVSDLQSNALPVGPPTLQWFRQFNCGMYIPLSDASKGLRQLKKIALEIRDKFSLRQNAVRDKILSENFFLMIGNFFFQTEFCLGLYLSRTEFCLGLHTAVVFHMQSFNYSGHELIRQMRGSMMKHIVVDGGWDSDNNDNSDWFSTEEPQSTSM